MKRKLNSKPFTRMMQHGRQLLADITLCSGPWTVLPEGTLLLDAAMTGGVTGFNAGASFGTAEHLECWTGETASENFAVVKAAWNDFVLRKPDPGRADDSKPELLNDPARLVWSYIQRNVLDQFQDQVRKLEAINLSKLQYFQQVHGAVFDNVQLDGLFTAVSCPTERLASQIRERAAGFGLLLPHSEGRLVPWQMNLSWDEETLEIFWRQLDRTVRAVAGGDLAIEEEPAVVSLRDTTGSFRFHEAMIRSKLGLARGRQSGKPDSARSSALDFFRDSLARPGQSSLQPVIVRPANWTQFRAGVEALQREVYEPARQTGMEKFDKLVESPAGIAILLVDGPTIVAIAFAGPLALFPDERGTADDPWRDDPDVLYMLDVTVRKEYRGSLGKLMKQALTLQAVASGRSAIHGRNRDRLAASMWAINLSVGSVQIRHLPNDYPDQEQFRDCIYYRCPLRWQLPEPGTLARSRVELMQNLSMEQYRVALARLANGYSPWDETRSGGLAGGLMPAGQSQNGIPAV